MPGNLPSARSASGGGVEATPVVNLDASGNPVYAGVNYLPPGVSRSATATAANTSYKLADPNTTRRSLIGQARGGDAWFNELGGPCTVNGADCYMVADGSSFAVATQHQINWCSSVAGGRVVATET